MLKVHNSHSACQISNKMLFKSMNVGIKTIKKLQKKGKAADLAAIAIAMTAIGG